MVQEVSFFNYGRKTPFQNYTRGVGRIWDRFKNVVSEADFDRFTKTAEEKTSSYPNALRYLRRHLKKLANI